MFRNWLVWISLAVSLVTAAQAQSVPEGFRPIDAEQYYQAVFKQYPEARAFGLFRRNGRGFAFDREGRAYFLPDGALHRLVTRTRVASVDGNRVCLARTQSWEGTCIEVFRRDNEYFVRWKFGKNIRRSYRGRVVLDPKL